MIRKSHLDITISDSSEELSNSNSHAVSFLNISISELDDSVDNFLEIETIPADAVLETEIEAGIIL